jgi:bisphosphoglycerate-independent phosphoglycerate mutase (AlkP superfamily)
MTVENVENCAGWNIGGEDENILVVNLLAPAPTMLDLMGLERPAEMDGETLIAK